MSSAIVFLCLLLIPCILYTIINLTFSKYSEIENKKELSGFEVAREILDKHDLSNVYIVEKKGNLNDHYDYDQKVIRLSSNVFHGESVTSAIVASRIASYAIQDKENYVFFKFRSTVNKVMFFINYLAFILFILGVCLKDIGMINLANYAITLVLLFHIITLPVEIDACKRARTNLSKISLFTKKQLDDYSFILNVSTCTFVMNVLLCIFTLINEIIYALQRKG